MAVPCVLYTRHVIFLYCICHLHITRVFRLWEGSSWDLCSSGILFCHQAFVAQLYKEEFFIGPRRVNMSMYTLIYANISLYLACSITQCNGACLQLKKYADPRTIAHFIWRPTHHRTLSMKTHAPSDTLHGDPRTIGHFTWRPTHHRTLYMKTHAPSNTLHEDPRTIGHFTWRPTHHRTLYMKTHAPSDTLHGDPRTIGHFTWRPTHHRALYMETHAPSDTLHGDPRTIGHFTWIPTHHRTLYMETHAPSDTLHGDPHTIGHFTWKPTHYRTLYMEISLYFLLMRYLYRLLLCCVLIALSYSNIFTQKLNSVLCFQTVQQYVISFKPYA